MDPDEREEAKRLFNETDERSVLLLSMTCGGVGLNLQGAHIMIIVDHPWNPQAEEQATHRIYRIG